MKKLSKKSQKVLLIKLELDLQEVKDKKACLLDLRTDGANFWGKEGAVYNGEIKYIEKFIREVKDLPF